MTAAAHPARAAIALGVATIGFALALAARAQLDPWWSTCAVAVVAGALAAWALGPRLRPLLAIDARGALVALALGVALVGATHAAYRGLVAVAPELGAAVRALYASVDLGGDRRVLAALTAIVVVGEELVWRGVAIELARGRRPAWSPRVVAASSVALYALPQLAGGVPVLVVAAVGLGSVFAAQRLATGRLADPLLTHLVWSVALFVVVPVA